MIGNFKSSLLGRKLYRSRWFWTFRNAVRNLIKKDPVSYPILDDRNELEPAEEVLISWKEGASKPTVGLVKDTSNPPYWTKYERFLRNNGFNFEHYDVHRSDWLEAAKGFPSVPAKALTGSLAIPEPTLIAMLDTLRLLISPPGDHPEFAEAMWADSIPKLLQARLIESFENYDIDHAPLRPMDGVQPDTQLALDIRRFQINADDKPVADIELSARIIDKDGKVVAARLFHEIQAFDHLDPKSAAAAFGAAFERLAQAMVKWVVQAP